MVAEDLDAPLTLAQLGEIRLLIEQNGFLPMTNKATRLFANVRAKRPNDPDLAQLQAMFNDAGYLPRSKALRLVELAS